MTGWGNLLLRVKKQLAFIIISSHGFTEKQCIKLSFISFAVIPEAVFLCQLNSKRNSADWLQVRIYMKTSGGKSDGKRNMSNTFIHTVDQPNLKFHQVQDSLLSHHTASPAWATPLKLGRSTFALTEMLLPINYCSESK